VLLDWAETLGIPWKHILVDEIAAEERLRRYLGNVEEELPLPFVSKLLSSSFLRSWRVREQIEGLAYEAHTSSSPEAAKRLRLVFHGLAGNDEGDKVAFAQHLWFAYQRILLLQRARRAAAKSHGDLPERLAFICSTARCSYDDAAWALLNEDTPQRGHILDAAVRKVREEGFRIPVAKTEARSFAKLRSLVRTSPHLRRLNVAPRSSGPARSTPRRVPLAVNAD